jgi:hypothetical protein
MVDFKVLNVQMPFYPAQVLNAFDCLLIIRTLKNVIEIHVNKIREISRQSGTRVSKTRERSDRNLNNPSF